MKKKAGERLNKIFEYFIVIAFSMMVLFVFVNAVLRYVANTGITQVEELSRYLFIWVSFLGAVAAYKENRHVGVSILVDSLKGGVLVAVKTLGYIAIFFTLGIMLWGSLVYTRTTAASLGPATNIPFAYMAISLTVATVGMIGIVLNEAIPYYKRLLKGGDDKCQL